MGREKERKTNLKLYFNLIFKIIIIVGMNWRQKKHGGLVMKPIGVGGIVCGADGGQFAKCRRERHQSVVLSSWWRRLTPWRRERGHHGGERVTTEIGRAHV